MRRVGFGICTVLVLWLVSDSWAESGDKAHVLFRKECGGGRSLLVVQRQMTDEDFKWFIEQLIQTKSPTNVFAESRMDYEVVEFRVRTPDKREVQILKHPIRKRAVLQVLDCFWEPGESMIILRKEPSGIITVYESSKGEHEKGQYTFGRTVLLNGQAFRRQKITGTIRGTAMGLELDVLIDGGRKVTLRQKNGKWIEH